MEQNPSTAKQLNEMSQQILKLNNSLDNYKNQIDELKRNRSQAGSKVEVKEERGKGDVVVQNFVDVRQEKELTPEIIEGLKQIKELKEFLKELQDTSKDQARFLNIIHRIMLIENEVKEVKKVLIVGFIVIVIILLIICLK